MNIEHLDHVAEHEEQYTEKFKLKGTSFHSHFQSELQHYKFCQLSELEPPALSLHFEPVNKQVENAIVVIAEIDGTTDPIGYIPGFLGLDVGNENHIGVLVIILCHNSP